MLQHCWQRLDSISCFSPEFTSIEDVMFAIFTQDRPASDGAGIWATGGLCQTKCCQFLTGRQGREVFLLLCWCSKQRDTLETDRLVSSEEDADTEVVLTHYFHHSCILQFKHERELKWTILQVVHGSQDLIQNFPQVCNSQHKKSKVPFILWIWCMLMWGKYLS